MDGLNLGLFALLQSIYTILALVLQFLTLPVFLKFADYRTRLSHQMMFSIGLFDSAQLFSLCLYVTCFSAGIQLPRTVERIASAVYILGWDALILQHVLLALNRALTIIRPYFRPASKESRLEIAIFKTLNLVLWLLFVCLVAAFQSPLLGGKFERENARFFFDMALPYSNCYRLFEFYFSIAAPSVAFCLYLGIIVVLKKSRDSAGNGKTQQSQPISAQERRILAQAGILFSAMLLFILAWFFLAQLDPLPAQLNIFLFIGYLTLNPILYLTLNSEFRQRFLRMYRFKKCICTNTVSTKPKPIVLVKSAKHVIDHT